MEMLFASNQGTKLVNLQRQALEKKQKQYLMLTWRRLGKEIVFYCIKLYSLNS